MRLAEKIQLVFRITPVRILDILSRLVFYLPCSSRPLSHGSNLGVKKRTSLHSFG
jgi:hypothetical protein